MLRSLVTWKFDPRYNSEQQGLPARKYKYNAIKVAAVDQRAGARIAKSR